MRELDRQWLGLLKAQDISYPSEYIIRIFKGAYPRLEMPRPRPGQSVLDVGCGDGRHLPFFLSLGLDAQGVEVTPEIVDHLRLSLSELGVGPERIQQGSCSSLPYQDDFFDYVVAWNSAYYMSLDNVDFSAHASELLRVLQPGGWLVLSIPKSTAFIFEDSEPSSHLGCRIIRKDPFGVREGEIMRVFNSSNELEAQFNDRCDNICHGDIHDDCFGYAYHWYILVARKREIS